MQMNDFVGNILQIGDDVAFTEYNRHALTRGVVSGFSKGMGMVEISYTTPGGNARKTKKTSGYVMKVVK